MRTKLEAKDVSLKTFKNYEKEGKNHNIREKMVVCKDSTFGTVIIYLYSDIDRFNEVRRKVFNSSEDVGPARGYCSYGSIDGNSTCVVWINNKYKLEKTIPTCMHEITHVAQNIISHTCIDDKSGEVEAYIIARECNRVLNKLYNIYKSKPTLAIDNIVQSIVSDMEFTDGTTTTKTKSKTSDIFRRKARASI